MMPVLLPDPSLIIAQANGVTEGVTLMIVGMTIVFCSLCVLLLLIALINRLWAQKPTVVAAQEVTTATESATASPAHDPQLVAVLTAAAIAVVRRPLHVHRVRSIRPDSGQAWTQSGRQSIMSSHRPHR